MQYTGVGSARQCQTSQAPGGGSKHCIFLQNACTSAMLHLLPGLVGAGCCGQRPFSAGTHTARSSVHACVAAQAQGRFERKLAFRPASLNSRFHKRLARAVDRSHTKASRVRKVRPGRNPETAWVQSTDLDDRS